MSVRTDDAVALAIAAEIRGPGHDSIPVDSLEAGPGSGAMYGTVEYLIGPNVDEPLEIQGIEPYRTWRGLIDGGQCLDGVCGNSGVIDYPGHTYEAYLTVRPSTQGSPVSWHGSLFAEGQDDGGLMYRRNRYYDPVTGQFTQEDPLGLAGGLNAYGFGAGDPINFADPFGLHGCPLMATVECFTASPPKNNKLRDAFFAAFAILSDGVGEFAEAVETALAEREATAGLLETKGMGGDGAGGFGETAQQTRESHRLRRMHVPRSNKSARRGTLRRATKVVANS